MGVGIERIDLYTSPFYVDAAELANLHGKDYKQTMAEQRSVIPVCEDSVTLAVNAARRMLQNVDVRNIELAIVNSESAVDFAKPHATWVHRFCGLSPNCRVFDVKHACYGGTGALKLAAAWAGGRPGKKALVVCGDFTRADIAGSGIDFIGGGCGVAMLVSDQPDILEFDPAHAGFWTTEISDTHRPTARHEIVHTEISLYSYLDALDGAFDHYEQVTGPVNLEVDFQKHIYHAPFPAMTLQAHRNLLGRAGISGDRVVESFQQRVEPGLCWAKRLGTAYGGSTFVCVMGLLHSAADLQPGDRISIFSYGSGCEGEFYDATIGARARELVLAAAVDQHIDARERLTPKVYYRAEDARQRSIECPNYVPEMDELQPAYERLYQGRKLVVLKKVEKYEREYGWS